MRGGRHGRWVALCIQKLSGRLHNMAGAVQGLTEKQQKLASKIRRCENRLANLQKEYDAIHVRLLALALANPHLLLLVAGSGMPVSMLRGVLRQHDWRKVLDDLQATSSLK